MKNFLVLFCLILVLSIIVFSQFMFKSFAQTTIANPWVDCGDNFNCAQKVSGIDFQLRLSNYWIRAMKGMVEISYPFDEIRSVSVRKTEKYIREDISGVYTHYKTNKQIKLKDGANAYIRANGKTIYVMNLKTKTGYYSAYCEQGMSQKEAEGVYEVLKEAEEAKINKNSEKNKYSFCELGDLVGKDVKRIKFNHYFIDYHSKDFQKKQVLKFANECLLENISNQYEMDCCMSQKMYPN